MDQATSGYPVLQKQPPLSTIFYEIMFLFFQGKHQHSWQHLKPQNKSSKLRLMLKGMPHVPAESTHLWNVPILPNLELWQLKVYGILVIQPRIAIRSESCTSPANLFSTAWSISVIQRVHEPTGSGILPYPTPLHSCSKWLIDPEKLSMLII